MRERAALAFHSLQHTFDYERVPVPERGQLLSAEAFPFSACVFLFGAHARAACEFPVEVEEAVRDGMPE